MNEPAACLLHADVHPMGQECWRTTLDWYLNHEELPDDRRRNAYQAAVERRMLDQIRNVKEPTPDVL